MSFPATFTGSLQLTGTSKITNTNTGAAPAENVQIGQNSFGNIQLQATQAAASGSTGQCKGHYVAQVTLASSGQSTVALTGFTDSLGDSVSLTNIKMVLASIQSANGTKRVAIGPQGVSNGWYTPFSAITTNGATLAAVNFTEVCWIGSTLASTGFSAGAGNYQLVLQETSGTTTTCQLLIWGS